MEDRLKAATVLLCTHGVGAAEGVPDALASQIRALDVFGDVASCQLKGPRGLLETLRHLNDRSVFLVPLLMAEGHTFRTVLPDLLSQAGARPHPVRCCRPLGVQPGLAAVAIAMAEEACAGQAWLAADTALVFAAHGTTRHPASGESAQRLADAVEASGRFQSAQAGFLEQSPSLDDALSAEASRQCVVVGFFMTEGSHSAVDVPRAVEAAPGPAVYCGPIGTRPEIAELVIEMVRAEAAEAK